MRWMRQLGIVLLGLGLVTAAIYGTGAFSGLTAQRSAQVSVTGDASGYIALQPAAGQNGQYATQNARGELEIKLGANADGNDRGVNKNAVTSVNDVFTITNQGGAPVGLWLNDKSDAVTFTVGGDSIEGKSNTIELAPGNPTPVSIEVDTRRVAGDQDLLRSMSVHASSNVKGRSVGGVSSTRSGPDSGFEADMGDVRTEQSRSGDGVISTILDSLGPGDHEELPTNGKASLEGSLVPGGDGILLLSQGSRTTPQHNESDGKQQSDPSRRSVPTPSDESSESKPSDEDGQVPCHAPAGPESTPGMCDPDPEGGDSKLDLDNPVVQVALLLFVAAPVDGAGPTDEVAAGGYVGYKGWQLVTGAIAFGGAMIGLTDNGGEEQSKERQEVNNNENQKQENEQRTERNGPENPRPPKRPPPPPGGEEDYPDGYEDLREQGVPEETIEVWEKEGYDLERMSDGLKRYRKSGETISVDSPAGDLAEILAEPTVRQEFRSDSVLVSNVKLKGEQGDTKGEFDYVVLNPKNEVIGVVEVKHADDDAGKAKRQLKKGLRNINNGRVDSINGDVTTKDFTRSDDIRRLRIGPSSDKKRVEEANIPEDALTTYHEHLEMSDGEFKELSEYIIKSRD